MQRVNTPHLSVLFQCQGFSSHRREPCIFWMCKWRTGCTTTGVWHAIDTQERPDRAIAPASLSQVRGAPEHQQWLNVYLFDTIHVCVHLSLLYAWNICLTVDLARFQIRVLMTYGNTYGLVKKEKHVLYAIWIKLRMTGENTWIKEGMTCDKGH